MMEFLQTKILQKYNDMNLWKKLRVKKESNATVIMGHSENKNHNVTRLSSLLTKRSVVSSNGKYFMSKSFKKV